MKIVTGGDYEAIVIRLLATFEAMPKYELSCRSVKSVVVRLRWSADESRKKQTRSRVWKGKNDRRKSIWTRRIARFRGLGLELIDIQRTSATIGKGSDSPCGVEVLEARHDRRRAPTMQRQQTKSGPGLRPEPPGID